MARSDRRSSHRHLKLYAAVELMEPRVLLSAAPLINLAVITGSSLVLTASEALDPATVNAKSILVFTGGADHVLGTKDDMLVPATITYDGTGNTITIIPKVKSGTPYLVDVLGNIVFDSTDTTHLDGQFNGSNSPSGDGDPGSPYQIIVGPEAVMNIDAGSPVAGTINVQLFNAQTPITVANFEDYADNGSWDDMFFHRLVQAFVLQGGGFDVTNDTIGAVTPPANRQDSSGNPIPIKNEPGVSNTIDTIAMAKTQGSKNPIVNANSATDQWFFNLANNGANLNHQNGGFTAFGAISPNDTASLTELGALAALPPEDISSVVDPNDGSNSPFTETPIVNLAQAEQTFDPLTDLALVNTITIQMLNPVPGGVATASLTGKPPPSPVVIGLTTSTTETITLKNVGPELSGEAVITLYASPIQAFNTATSVSLNTSTQSVTVGPNQTITLTIPVGTFAGVTPGANFLTAQITGLGSTTLIAESAQTVNVEAADTQLSAKVTAIPTKISTAGQNATYSVEVFNTGNTTIQGSLPIDLSGSINSDGSSPVAFGPDSGLVTENINLAPGAHVIFNITEQIPAGVATQNYYIVAAIDPNNTLNELTTPTLAVSVATAPVIGS